MNSIMIILNHCAHKKLLYRSVIDPVLQFAFGNCN
jgi:hypothetical protein